MKQLFFSAAALIFTSAAFAQQATTPSTPAKTVAEVAKFDSSTINLGTIRQGTPTKATYTVTNIGTTPLLIEQANPTCGCTISDYTKTPIEPGKTGTINATYNAAAVGHFEKHLTVKFAGINEIKNITLTGEVLQGADYDKLKAEQVRQKAVADSIAAASAKPVKKHVKKAANK